MPLIKDGALVEDSWRYADCDSGVPADGAVIVTLDQWKAGRDDLLKRNTPLGLKLASGEEPGEVLDDLGRFDVIALEFPQFKNGRAYSYARLLRERYGYKGELRAVGDVLRDQIQFMARCGINAFEVCERISLADYQAAMDEISVFFQPTGDGRETALSLRHRRGTAANVAAGAG